MKLSAFAGLWVIVTGVVFSLPVIAMADDAPVYDVDSYPPQFDDRSAHTSDVAPGYQAVSPAARGNAPVVVSNEADDDEGNSAPSASRQSSSASSLTPDQRVARLEQQINNLQQTNSSDKAHALETEVQSLRGQVEELTHQLQQAQSQQRAMYTELDKRVGQASAVDHSPVVAAPSKKTSASTGLLPLASSNQKTASPSTTVINHDMQPNSEEEQKVYQKAYDLIKAKKYDGAISALQKMLKKYPSGQFAANAHYWLGELYSLVSKNDQAVTEFSTVVDHYPDNTKAADAELKLGLIYSGQSKYPEAKAAFQKVTAKYPGTASSRLAMEQLSQLKNL